jgi:hypothetical protein
MVKNYNKKIVMWVCVFCIGGVCFFRMTATFLPMLLGNALADAKNWITTIGVPKPQVKYGEFPYKIEFEYNGEIVTRNNTIICEFAKIDEYTNEPEWNIRKKNVEEEKVSSNPIVMLNIPLESGAKAQSAGIMYGHAQGEYLLGNQSRPLIWISMYFDGTYHRIEAEKEVNEFLERYGIKIISVEETSPIKNIFK